MNFMTRNAARFRSGTFRYMVESLLPELNTYFVHECSSGLQEDERNSAADQLELHDLRCPPSLRSCRIVSSTALYRDFPHSSRRIPVSPSCNLRSHRTRHVDTRFSCDSQRDELSHAVSVTYPGPINTSLLAPRISSGAELSCL